MTKTATDRKQRIIIQRSIDGDQWYAWFAEFDEAVWSASTARGAIQRLLTANPDFGAAIGDLVEDTLAFEDGHFECVPKQLAACPDCRGSGKYVGFSVIEDCHACEGTGCGLPPRIDVVKRRQIYRLLFHRFFEKRHGYVVRSFDSIESYLDQLSIEPDCIICGMHLLDGDGLQLLREVSQRGITSPVIISTMQSDYEHDANDQGAFAFLSDREFGQDKYLATLKRAIANRRSLAAK